MSLLRPFVIVLSVTFACPLFAETVTFEGLLPSAETFYNGNTGVTNSDGWTAGGVDFSNNYNAPTKEYPFEYWSGWSYSNVTDSTTANVGNQYASAPGKGSDFADVGGANGTYAVAFGDGAYFNLPDKFRIASIDWTNSAYARLSMENGDAANGSGGPGKQFGGPSGTDLDFFRVQLTGYAGTDLQGASTGSVTLSLADYTAPDAANDFIVDDWQVGEDLTGLGAARSVGLTFASSDTSTFDIGGVPTTFINTPTYFAIDNLAITAIPEPASGLLLSMIGAVVVICRRRR